MQSECREEVCIPVHKINKGIPVKVITGHRISAAVVGVVVFAVDHAEN